MTTIETTADTVVKIKPIDSGILEKNQKCALPKGFKAILAPNVAARQVAGHTAVWLTDAVKVNDGKTTTSLGLLAALQRRTRQLRRSGGLPAA